MIKALEIQQKAKEFQIDTSDLQRDYVFGWLLSGIYNQSPLSNQLILKGGNSLRKAYLKNTRFSKDLDFSVIDSVDPLTLVRQLNDVCLYAQDKSGVQFAIDETRVIHKPMFDREQRQVFEARLYFNSFYKKEEVIIKVQLDVTTFDKILLPPQTIQLIHPYSDADACTALLRCQKLEEILASKLNALIQRRKASDLFDLVYAIFFSNQFAVHRGEVITTFLKKTIYEPDPLAAKNLLLSVPAEEHRPFWKKIIAPVASIFDFDAGVVRFRELVNNLFALVPAPVPALVSPGISAPRRLTGYGGYASVNYFPAGLRDVLISAGRSNTLVELTYDGYMRLVEPYAFEYRIRKKDGVGMEYFWGWDQSGGKSGKTGIKMFISDKIESVSPTSMSFHPRFPVEF
jgi:predicted nucleotidyltransferase component of viral defense system